MEPIAIPTFRARDIMGRNMFGVEEAIKHFGVNPAKEQVGFLTDIPFTDGTLESCKLTHILVAVFPISILEIHDNVERRLFYRHENAWYNKKHSFAKDKGNVSWQLIRKTPVRSSTSKNWQDQQALLAENEETPTSRVMAYTTIGHYLSSGERIFERVYVRCSDVDLDGFHVNIGRFNHEGLDIRSIAVNICNDDLGLASGRKLDSEPSARP